MRENDGKWIQMYSGGAFWPLDPRPCDVSIYDIAHGLAMQCRWTGQTRRHYSVAQHSVLVADNVSKEAELKALLHDASEAYISDIARPTKPDLTNYYLIEMNIMRAIFVHFGLTHDMPDEIKAADDLTLMWESRDLMRPPVMPWTYVPAGRTIPSGKLRAWPPLWSEIRFLWRFGRLTGTLWPTMRGWLKLKWEDICS